MTNIRRFELMDMLLLGLVVLVAAGLRAGYLAAYADAGRNGGPLRVDDPLPTPPDSAAGPTSELDAMVHNIVEKHEFRGPAPFSPGEELTAHTAPGYPYLLAGLNRMVAEESLKRAVRWLQCGLGALTAGLYFLFARRAFRHLGVATLAGLFSALDPFAVISTAAVSDGVVASFLVALAIWLGARTGQSGGPFGSLLFGLTLAASALVRAALAPFAFLALAWFLLRSRTLPGGWLFAVLAFLGFAIGLAPWTVRNFQDFNEPVPIVDSTHYHLWVGNNTRADGGPVMPAMLATVNAAELEAITRQPERYARLGTFTWEAIRTSPAASVRHRGQAALAFFLGKAWLDDGTLAVRTGEGDLTDRLAGSYPVGLQVTLLGMLALALLGWRWAYGWRWEAMPSSLALIWIPLPYILGHAEALSGPRLPLDGLLLSYAAFALMCVVPSAGTPLFAGSDRGRRDDSP
jgi:hypothetical protein